MTPDYVINCFCDMLQVLWKSGMRSAETWALSCPTQWSLTTPLSQHCVSTSTRLLCQSKVRSKLCARISVRQSHRLFSYICQALLTRLHGASLHGVKALRR